MKRGKVYEPEMFRWMHIEGSYTAFMNEMEMIWHYMYLRRYKVCTTEGMYLLGRRYDVHTHIHMNLTLEYMIPVGAGGVLASNVR